MTRLLVIDYVVKRLISDSAPISSCIEAYTQRNRQLVPRIFLPCFYHPMPEHTLAPYSSFTKTSHVNQSFISSPVPRSLFAQLVCRNSSHGDYR